MQDSLGNTVWSKLTASTGTSGPFWAGLAGGTGNAITITDSAFALQDGATIQFLRSRISGSMLAEGRLAISTNSEANDVVRAVEQHYRSLRTFVKKRCRNGMLQWRNPSFPESSAADGRSANPGKADDVLWIGPAAVQWLREEPTMRKVKQEFAAPVEAVLTLEARLKLPKS